MATKAEVRDRAAQELGILRIGQALNAASTARIEAAYSEIYARLKKEGLATWASTAEVPDELVPFVAALVALSCTGTYSVSAERLARIQRVTGIDGERALREVRKLVSPSYVSDDPTDY